ncbi:MAG: ATP-binding protein [Patescibacteria group bacterium]
MTEPALYLLVGYPGAGKTSVARTISQATGAVHLWSDAERHKMFANPTHSQQESLSLYDHLNQRTDELLAEGKSVVFDTNFNFQADRQKLREIADRHNASTVILWINTPAIVAKKRAVGTEINRNGYMVSMSDEQFDDIAAKLEQPTEDEKVIKIDGTKLDEVDVMQLLSQ